jgi:hypothetical protein
VVKKGKCKIKAQVENKYVGNETFDGAFLLEKGHAFTDFITYN